MCPDRQILSVYVDQELPSPWKEKLEAHLAECSDCRERLAGYRRAFPGPGFAVEEAAKERVWLNVARFGVGTPVRPRAEKWWTRSISLPLPVAAAAAAAILVFALAVLTLRKPAVEPDTAVAAGMELDVQGIVPVSDMNGVIQYLGGEDTADIVIIRLPESRRFMSSGEPAIIKAADYVRRNTSR
jgi:hypothetical protein